MFIHCLFIFLPHTCVARLCMYVCLYVRVCANSMLELRQQLHAAHATRATSELRVDTSRAALGQIERKLWSLKHTLERQRVDAADQQRAAVVDDAATK